MIKEFLSYLVIYGLRNNVVTNNGSGALIFQREKMYTKFRYLNTLLLMLGIIICSAATYALNKFVYAKFDLFYISVSVSVFIVCLYNILVATIWRKASNFSHYLYDSSFSYPSDVVYTLSIILTLDFSLSLVSFVLSVAAIVLVVFVMNMFIGFFLESSNRSYMNASFRNVPSRLFLMAIFAVILYYANLLIV